MVRVREWWEREEQVADTRGKRGLEGDRCAPPTPAARRRTMLFTRSVVVRPGHREVRTTARQGCSNGEVRRGGGGRAGGHARALAAGASPGCPRGLQFAVIILGGGSAAAGSRCGQNRPFVFESPSACPDLLVGNQINWLMAGNCESAEPSSFAVPRCRRWWCHQNDGRTSCLIPLQILITDRSRQLVDALQCSLAQSPLSSDLLRHSYHHGHP